MTETVKEIKIDVQKKRAGEAVVAKQCDAKSRFLRVTVCSGGTKITVAQDAEAVINALRPDGASKSFFCTVNGDGTVTAPLTGWMLECAGVLRCSISVLGVDGERLTSTTFFVDVEPAEGTDGDIENDENVDVLAELVVECREATGAANGAASAANAAAGTAMSAAGAANEAATSANSAAEAARGVADLKLDKSAVVQETGGGVDVVMSQKAVTEAIAAGDTQGVNLLTGTKDFSGDWLQTGNLRKNSAYNTLTVYSGIDAWSGIYQKFDVTQGETYTFSFFARADGALHCTAFAEPAGGAISSPRTMQFTATTEWKRYSFSFEAVKDAESHLRIESETSGTPFYVCGYKLESGKVKTTVWTPAPEDVVTSWRGAGFHNSIFRGKYLGDAVTEAQYAAISAGTFDDMYVGDYWTINGVNWLIAGFDYLCKTGDTETAEHHAVIIPETGLYNAKMNDLNTTAGGYALSQMRTQNLDEAKETVNAAFPGHVLTYRALLTNAVTDGHPSGDAWFDCEIELMSEVMCYGTQFYSAVANNGMTAPDAHTIFRTQLPIFRMRPDMLTGRGTNFWLQDVCSPTYFCIAGMTGDAVAYLASMSFWVRPFFLIGG